VKGGLCNDECGETECWIRREMILRSSNVEVLGSGVWII
jgi:hypothetical protein